MALWIRWREHLELRVGKVARLLPNIEHVLNSRRRGQWHLVSWCLDLCFRPLLIHVVTADLMLCAVTADSIISSGTKVKTQERGGSPLREGFITSDMSTLACFASCPALGMTAPRGTGALTSHVEDDAIGLQLDNRGYSTFEREEAAFLSKGYPGRWGDW